ncbi:MAG: hypothetical protein IK125_07460 [Lachnospiraceae bacterium]|nr:hypothetical protein [Lachnospiraceae bacterium]
MKVTKSNINDIDLERIKKMVSNLEISRVEIKKNRVREIFRLGFYILLIFALFFSWAVSDFMDEYRRNDMEIVANMFGTLIILLLIALVVLIIMTVRRIFVVYDPYNNQWLRYKDVITKYDEKIKKQKMILDIAAGKKVSTEGLTMDGEKLNVEILNQELDEPVKEWKVFEEGGEVIYEEVIHDSTTMSMEEVAALLSEDD